MARLGNGSVQYKFSAAVICSGIVSLSTAVAAAVGLIKEETFLLLFFSFFRSGSMSVLSSPVPPIGY